VNVPYVILMLLGGAVLSYGFYLTGEGKGNQAWTGIGLLFAGFAIAFFGVLLAFAPRFFD